MSRRDFQGKVAVITGGAQGLGAAFAARFARDGANIAIIDLQIEKCELVAARLATENGVGALGLVASVSDSVAIKSAIEQITARFGRIDIWVNNAGIYRGTPTEDLTMQEWALMLEVNYTGVFVCTQAIEPILKAQHSGRVINMSSIAGRTGFKNSLAYCSNKAAVIGITRASAMDLAAYGITVNAVCPGTIMTEMVEKVDAAVCKAEGWPPGTHLKNKATSIPAQRLGTVEDVAGVVAFLASDDASFVTGQAIEVDGGELLI